MRYSVLSYLIQTEIKDGAVAIAESESEGVIHYSYKSSDLILKRSFTMGFRLTYDLPGMMNSSNQVGVCSPLGSWTCYNWTIVGSDPVKSGPAVLLYCYSWTPTTFSRIEVCMRSGDDWIDLTDYKITVWGPKFTCDLHSDVNELLSSFVYDFEISPGPFKIYPKRPYTSEMVWNIMFQKKE